MSKRVNDETAVLQKKKENSLAKRSWRSVIVITVIITVLIGAFVGIGLLFEYQYQHELITEKGKEPKENMTYFVSDKTEPEKAETEITSLITEAYYTNDGSLAVRFCFANGMEKSQHLNSVEVEIRNKENNVIAAGFSDAIVDSYSIPAGGTATLLLYISPEYVKITNDALNTISYDITTKYEEVK